MKIDTITVKNCPGRWKQLAKYYVESGKIENLDPETKKLYTHVYNLHAETPVEEVVEEKIEAPAEPEAPVVEEEEVVVDEEITLGTTDEEEDFEVEDEE